jgi:hypothetical protein
MKTVQLRPLRPPVASKTIFFFWPCEETYKLFRLQTNLFMRDDSKQSAMIDFVFPQRRRASVVQSCRNYFR